MIKRKRVSGIVAGMILASSAVAVAQEEQGDSAAAAQAADAFPRACVDCHTVREQGDMRLSAIMQSWTEAVKPGVLARIEPAAPEGMQLKGKHPKLPEKAFADVPASCMPCHKEGSKMAPPLGNLMHLVHLTGEENHYQSLFQGTCAHCHKADGKGGWQVPSGAEE